MVSGSACVLGFNLNMRATNSLITAGLGPVGVWTQGNLGQFKCSERGSTPQRPWKCLSRRRLWGTMTFPSRDDVSQAFCVSVCVCLCVCVVSSSGQGQARGESGTANQWCGHQWERQKHSQLTQLFLWGIALLRRGRITSTVGFLRVIQTSAQQSKTPSEFHAVNPLSELQDPAAAALTRLHFKTQRLETKINKSPDRLVFVCP